MFSKNWKKEIFTIPNLLSLLRLLMIPVYLVIYLRADEPADYFAAGGILALSCLTDMIDGRIARKYGMISTLGKILDPLADKATQFALTLCLSLRYPILQPVLMLFVVKECFQIAAGIIALFNGQMLTGALPAGKLCTTVLFSSLIALVLFPDLPGFLVDAIAATDTVFLAAAFVSYILAYYGKNRKTETFRKQA